MIKLRLDPDYKPAVLELRKFREDVLRSGNFTKLGVSIERNHGNVYRREFDVFKDGVDDERNTFIIERFIKSVLWLCGGYKIYIAGSKKIFESINDYYRIGGLREFDYNFMKTVFEHPVEVVYCTFDTLPEAKESSIPAGGNLNGRRIGFDLGGSDMKVSAVVNGVPTYSEEVVWLPKLKSNISYHYEEIYKALKIGIEALDGDVDAIGISTAGVIVNNKPMVSSLYIKVGKDSFDLQKNIYINSIKRLEDELGHKISFEVANDGDVTALAGALDLKDNCVLGIAMGTSEAVGYVNKNGYLNGWFSELAFVPVDFNEESMIDEWSGDFGVGCKYFSQDAVIKLAPKAGIEIDKTLTLAEQLKFVQKLHEKDDPRAIEIFETIGVYLAYSLAFYAEFYEIKHVLLLGRVTSGKGGDVILKTCRDTLFKEFPEYSNIEIGMPSEHMRRVGQSIAAASLPKA